MKTRLIGLLMGLLIITSGCGARAPGDTKPDNEQIRAEGSIETPGAPGMPPASEPPPKQPAGEDIEPEDGRLVLLGLPLYRGVITSIVETDSIYELRLEQVRGSSFGYSTMTMHTSEEIQSATPLSELAVGDYLEVYFTDRTGGLPPVIEALNRLPAPEDCVFNGTVTDWRDEGDEPLLTLRAPDGGESMTFRCDSATNFYLERDKLQNGVNVNVFYEKALSGGEHRALEVRIYEQ